LGEKSIFTQASTCVHEHQRLFAIAITYACCIISALHRWLMLPEELCSISPIGRLEMFRYITPSVCSVRLCVCVCCTIFAAATEEAVTVTVCGYLCNTACHTRPPSVVYSIQTHPSPKRAEL